MKHLTQSYLKHFFAKHFFAKRLFAKRLFAKRLFAKRLFAKNSKNPAKQLNRDYLFTAPWFGFEAILHELGYFSFSFIMGAALIMVTSCNVAELGDGANSGESKDVYSTEKAASDSSGTTISADGDKTETSEDAALPSDDDTPSDSKFDESKDDEVTATEPTKIEGEASIVPLADAVEVMDFGSFSQSGSLTAGDIDDHLNYGFFLNYFQSSSSIPIMQESFKEFSPRLLIRVIDQEGRGVSNAKIEFYEHGSQQLQLEAYTSSQGKFYLFPTWDGIDQNSSYDIVFKVASSNIQSKKTVDMLEALSSGQELLLPLENYYNQLPSRLELLLAIDTTGSMGDEIDYLKAEFANIIASVQEIYPQVSLSLGLVAYRDQGDEYLFREYPFTSSLTTMSSQLNQLQAGGGGDFPEAMHIGLEKSLTQQWSQGNVARLLFLITDAPPHQYDYASVFDQVNKARSNGIRIFPLASSGIDRDTEQLLRSVALLTQGRYLFLTDDSGLGGGHLEPDEHFACYVVTKLNNLIMRVIAAELSAKRIEPQSSEIIRTVGDYDSGICGQQ